MRRMSRSVWMPIGSTGAGQSAVALFDVLNCTARGSASCTSASLGMESGRKPWVTATSTIVRWPSTFCIGVKPHLVLGKCPEKGTPKTTDAVESHRRSCEYASRVFADFAA